MSHALKTSRKNIMSIREYCKTFLNLTYVFQGKLTHDKLLDYAYEKKVKVPSKCKFDTIKEEQLLRGECYLVKDEVGKIIAYKNESYNLNNINLEQRKNVLEARREQILRCMGLKPSEDGVISLNEADSILYEEERLSSLGSLIDKNNRVKRLMNIKRK